ncbi:MAG: hypothetical protein ACE5JO_05730, partial [Candidatus Binatia bacterium]
HEVAAPIDEMEHTADIDLFERIEKGMVHQRGVTGISECPADMRATFLDFEVRVLSRGDTLINFS